VIDVEEMMQSHLLLFLLLQLQCHREYHHWRSRHQTGEDWTGSVATVVAAVVEEMPTVVVRRQIVVVVVVVAVVVVVVVVVVVAAVAVVFVGVYGCRAASIFFNKFPIIISHRGLLTVT